MCRFAGVVKLVDTQVLGTCGASRGGSSPFARTNANWLGHAKRILIYGAVKSDTFSTF